jgi:hypothetical protein
MAVLSLFLLSIFILLGWLLCLAYRETEQDFPPVHRCHRHLVPGRVSESRIKVQVRA